MKACLVYPNQMQLPVFFDKVTSIPKEPVMLPPLGALYVISNSEYEIDFIDNRVNHYSDEELFNKLKKYDVVGFSGTIFEILQAKNVSRMLMKEGVTTVYGGPNATVNWNLYMNDFNIIALGEGETLIDEILNNLSYPRKVKGVVFKDGEDTVHTSLRPLIKDLDKLNFPDREKIDLNNYEREKKNYLDASPVDTVVSSRGCPYDCAFCSSKHIWRRTIRFRSPKNVIEEIAFLIEKYGTKGIYFREDNFTVSKKRVLEFCNIVNREKMDIQWLCESRVDIDREMLVQMKKSGCNGVCFGIESGSDRILKQINKGFTINDVKRTVKLCQSVGIKCGGGFMIGLWDETREDMLHTMKFARKLDLDIRFFNRVFAIPKSEMYDLIKREGLDSYEFENIVIPASRHVSADEITEIFYNGTRRKTSLKKKIFMKLPLSKNAKDTILRWYITLKKNIASYLPPLPNN